MNTIRVKIVAVIFGLSLMMVLILTSIFSVGMSKEIYKEIQVKLQIADYAMCSQETLDYATDGLVEYIKGNREDLSMVGVINNIESYIFNEKEITHMVDVKNLFNVGKFILVSLGIFIVILFVIELIINREAFNYKFFKSVSVTLMAILVVFLLIAAYALFDFHSFWISFHKIFFTNDLYLLNPETDFLIRMMPLQFFIAIMLKIGIRLGIAYLVTLSTFIATHLILKGSKSK